MFSTNFNTKFHYYYQTKKNVYQGVIGHVKHSINQTTVEMECSVCYANKANCKLVCGHEFCRTCVKQWYYKGDGEECTCPMCRAKLYFKGMYKVIPLWEEERFEQKNQEAFAEAFENIIEEFENFEEYSDSDSDSDSWETDNDAESDDMLPETYISEYRSEMTLEDIMFIQERFNLLNTGGFLIEPEFIENDYYKITTNYKTYFYEDITPDEKFISKHKGTRQGLKRIGARRMEKVTQSEESLVVIVVL